MPDIAIIESHRYVLIEIVGPWIELGERVIHKAISHPGHANEEDEPEEIEKAPDVKQERELLTHKLAKGRLA